jgi:Family of unknown function (DUF6288)
MAWEWGYENLYLCEYFLATKDKDIFHVIAEYTAILLKGQGMCGMKVPEVEAWVVRADVP